MTLTINPQKTLAVLLVALALIYVANISFTGKLTEAMIDKPIELEFILISAPEGKCDVCIDPEIIVQAMDNAHHIAYETNVIDSNSSIGEKYIEIYSLVNLPAIIVSGHTANEALLGAWNSFQARIEGDRVIIENLLPYYDLSAKTVRGDVDIILLTDATCVDCFDVRAYLNIMQRFGIPIENVVAYDVKSDEGSKLVSTYAITKVPTLLASPEANVYQNLVNTWSQIGTVAGDGWFILREVQKISTEYISL